MSYNTGNCLLAFAPSGARIRIWTDTTAEVEALAEALHDARPQWRLRIDGRTAVFSREGRVVDLVSTFGRL